MSSLDRYASPDPASRGQAAAATRAFLAEGRWLFTGQDFFLALAQFLAQELDLDFVCIDRLAGDLLSAETLAVWSGGRFQDNVCYTLKDTPCGEVVGKALCTYQAGVRHLFPQDAVLQEMNAEGYAGATLWNTEGRPFGLIALIRNRPFADLGPVEAVLGLVAQRAAAELEVREVARAKAHSEALLDLAFEASPTGMVLARLDGRFVKVNPAFCALAGRSMAELDGLSWQNLTHPSDLGESRQALLDLASGQAEACVFQKRYLRPDGRTVWGEVHASLMRGADGQPLHTVAQVVDITERKRTEAALAAQEACLSSMLSTAMDGVWLLDADTRLLEANGTASAMLGYRREELLGLRVSDIEVAETSEETALHVQRVKERGADLFTSVHRRKDGSTFPVEVSVTALPGTGQMVAYVRDITLRRKEELERAQIFERISDAFVALDRDWRYTFVNEKAGRIFGRRPEDLIGRHIWTEFPEGLGQPFHLAYEKALQDQEPARLEEYYPPYDRWFENHIYPSPEGLTIYFHDITDRKRAERDLRESEARFNTAFQATPVALGITTLAEGRFVMVNRAFEVTLGWTREELLGHPASQFHLWVDPSDRDRITQAIEAGDSVRDLEVQVRRRDGGLRWASYSGDLVNLQGTACLLSVVLDITERRSAEETLREREELLRLSLQGADLGAWDWEIPSGTVSVNDRWLEMLGLQSRADLCVETWSTRIHPQDLPTVQATLEAHLRGETAAYESEHRLRHVSGDWIWVLDRGCVIKRGPSGEPLRMCGTHLDLTEWKWSAMVEAARLRLIEFSVSHSLDGLLQAAVDEACELTESPIGFYHLIEGEERTIVLHAWSTRTEREFCTAQGRGSHYPLERAGVWADCLRERRALIHNDYASLPNRKGLPEGHAPVIRELVVPLFRENRIVAILGVGNKAEDYRPRDLELVQRLIDHAWSIVERKRAEDARRELEHQLQQSQKMESLGNLAGGVAHDLNNVLGAILSLSSALRSKVLPPDPLTTPLDTIMKACVRGRDVVRNLLLFARRGLEEEHPVELNALVRDLISLLAHTTLQRINLVTELEEGLAPVMADGSALSHAVMNLCVNAVDAMPEGGTLTLATRRTPQGGQSLLVRDTGCGMTEEVLARAMDPFFTTKPVGKGTGLGLAMAYGTLQAHGGTLDIRSQVGEGTELLLTLPANRVLASPPEPGPTLAESASSGAQLRILLVDDDPLVRESTGVLLETLGHAVHATAGGQEALEALRGGLQVDLAILDMNMPGLTGAETLPLLRELRPNLAVMVATGFADERTQDLPNRYPAVRLIEKPYALAEIQRQMGDLLASGGASGH